MENSKGKIVKVAGPLVIAKDIQGAKMGDVVKVGKFRLVGEIIELNENLASIQVYEETAGMGPGDKVETTGEPLSVELGPGLVTSIYDGIQRPLQLLEEASGAFIGRGITVNAVDRKKKWEFKPLKQKGDKVVAGDIIGQVQETAICLHKIMVPHGIEGTIEEIKSGSFTVAETVATIAGKDVSMLQRFPVRKRRPFAKKLPVTDPITTGQRIIDSLFTVTKGGTAAIPGPFGSGKTVVQHMLAKWSDVDIVIFVGCGERGNEMTDVLLEFPELKDPKSGRSLMERTILIANTSNMPIAAREASVYTGAAIAEYYRDMGYNVALMADSTSRWAEALREMSGRLEEMPGEEGYPAYLGSRVAEFYERAGKGVCVGRDGRIGTLSIVGSVSPPGGDLSEPVVQNTLRIVKVFWGLDYKLAHKRHFPAINWLISYSLYLDNIDEYMKANISEEWSQLRAETMKLLQQESELEEIVRLVGVDSLSAREQLILLITKSIREDFLYQNAFDPVDQFSTLQKQFKLLKLIITYYHESRAFIDAGGPLNAIKGLKSAREISKMRLVPNEEDNKIDELEKDLVNEIRSRKGEKVNA